LPVSLNWTSEAFVYPISMIRTFYKLTTITHFSFLFTYHDGQPQVKMNNDEQFMVARLEKETLNDAKQNI